METDRRRGRVNKVMVKRVFSVFLNNSKFFFFQQFSIQPLCLAFFQHVSIFSHTRIKAFYSPLRSFLCSATVMEKIGKILKTKKKMEARAIKMRKKNLPWPILSYLLSQLSLSFLQRNFECSLSTKS